MKKISEIALASIALCLLAVAPVSGEEAVVSPVEDEYGIFVIHMDLYGARWSTNERNCIIAETAVVAHGFTQGTIPAPAKIYYYPEVTDFDGQRLTSYGWIHICRA